MRILFVGMSMALSSVLASAFAAGAAGAAAKIDTVVRSATAAPAMREPERFAFVLGNSRYGKSGTLSDIPDACPEARNLRKRLLEIGWQADHLFPKVSPPEAGETLDDAVDRAICNKTGREIDQQLGDFMSMLASNEHNPYGVVFYAGHGAQSNGEFYGFGVDAVIDPDWELKQLNQFDTYEVFSRPVRADRSRPPAVNLSRLAAQAQGPNGRALLMIVDACRNDPLLDQFMSKQPRPAPGVTQETMKRLWVTYMGGMQSYDRDLSNVIILFASGSGRLAQSGTELAPNWFATHLMDFMSKESHLSVGATTFVNDFEVQAAYKQRALPPPSRQLPSHIGRMASKPEFCFRGCANPVDAYSTERMELIAESKRAPYAMATSTPRTVPERAVYRNVAWRAQAAVVSEKLAALEADSAAPTPAAPASAPTAEGRVDDSGGPPRPVNLDVFYCTGDSLAGGREAIARAFAQRTRESYPKDVRVQGTYLDAVRLRSLPFNDNMKSASPRVGTTLVLGASEPASSGWSERLAGTFAKTYSDNVTKGVMRAYFCDDVATSGVRPTVYPHVAHNQQLGPARKTVDALAAKLQDFGFTRIQAVQEGRHAQPIGIPKRTELRCYGPGACERAPEIAVQLASQVVGPLRVVHLKGPLVDNARNPVIELWFGEQQLADWDAGAKH